jgi:hypothetical protein
MGALVIVVPVGILTIITYFVLSPETASWLTLICFAVWNIFSLIKSFTLYKAFLNGTSVNAGEIIAMAAQPFTSSVTLIAIACLLFIDVNKFHLLWFYPVISIIFDLTIGKRAAERMESYKRNSFTYNK